MSANSLIAFAPGDPDTGIPSQTWTINDIGELDHYPQHREYVRSVFTVAFTALVGDGERVRVLFDDELR